MKARALLRVALLPLCLVAAPVACPSNAGSGGPSFGNTGAQAPVAAGNARLRVTFVDVGQGDAALLETSDGHAAMIDTGPPDGRAHLRQVLAQRGITQLDWLVLSHPHLDHIGNARDVLDRVRVGMVLDPGYPHAIATYERLLDRIQALGIAYHPARAGGTLALGAMATVEILQPHEPFVAGSRSDVNANSAVLRVTAGNVRVLFPGDAERETEQRLLAEDPAYLRADVLKVAHHGSAYASSDAFLSAVAPRWAVISCATGNDYGHPAFSTLQALARHNISFFRTDANGDVTLVTDGAGVQIGGARAADAATMMAPGADRGGREPQ